jgi:hypothetical protein
MAYTDFAVPAYEDMTRAQQKAAEWAWSHGELDAFILPHQETLWTIVCAHMGLPTECELPDEYKPILSRTSTMKPLVIEVARRFGKSSLVLLAMIALCIRNKRRTYYFVAPNEGDAEDILDDVYPNVIATCPPHLRPRKMKMTFFFKNGSRIKIGGTFNGAEGLRGRGSNGSAVDEAGSIPMYNASSCLTYVVSSILQPSLMTTKGWQVILTTPPANMQHDYYKMAASAEKDGRFIRMDIHQNTSFTEAEIEEIKEASYATDPTGGAWSREYLCQPKPDSKLLIIPEATQERLKPNVRHYERPPYFEYLHKYIVIDHGTVDLNAILFGYYDFPQAKLVIEKELPLPGGPTTKTIAKEIQAAREALWGKGTAVERAICDSISQQLRIDLNAEFNDLFFVAPLKTILLSDNGAREGMVNQLITTLDDSRIIIDPSCKMLLETIRTSQWKLSATGKREFARFDEIGHCDFLASLMYLWRGVYLNVNPLAGRMIPDVQTNFVLNPQQKQGAAQTLRRVINKTVRNSIFARTTR